MSLALPISIPLRHNLWYRRALDRGFVFENAAAVVVVGLPLQSRPAGHPPRQAGQAGRHEEEGRSLRGREFERNTARGMAPLETGGGGVGGVGEGEGEGEGDNVPSRVMCVHVAGANALEPDTSVIHPVVKLHVVDPVSGKRLGKRDASRNIVHTRENGAGTIPPVLTKPYDFVREGTVEGTLVPTWNESIVYDEGLDYFLDRSAMLLFEVLDFGPHLLRNEAATLDGGLVYRICWGFLRLASGGGGSAGEANLGPQRIRLHRYERDPAAVRLSTSQEAESPGVYRCYKEWLSRKVPAQRREMEYPASLAITVAEIPRPDAGPGKFPSGNFQDTDRPRLPYAVETGRMVFGREGMALSGPGETSASLPLAPQTFRRPRKAHERCAIPNSMMSVAETGSRGCSRLTYSHSGDYLAAACGMAEHFVVKVLDAYTGALLLSFLGHYEIVYDLSWSVTDDFLLSASSDLTVLVWNVSLHMGRVHEAGPAFILQHPSFVYSARFSCVANGVAYSGGSGREEPPFVVLTGSYDRGLRVWDCSTSSPQLLPASVFPAHRGHINCMCTSALGDKVYTCDSHGDLKEWALTAHTIPGGGLTAELILLRNVGSVKPIVGVPGAGMDRGVADAIISIALHPNGRRLCLLSKGNDIIILELKSFAVIKNLRGARSANHPVAINTSPDGHYIVSGSEDGKACLWDLETGKMAVLEHVNLRQQPIYQIAWNPKEHMFAVCSYGTGLPILIYAHDPNNRREDELIATFLAPGPDGGAGGGDGILATPRAPP